MSDSLEKLPEGAPPLPDERDTTFATQTVADVIFELFRRHTLTFIVGTLIFLSATLGALADEATKLGWVHVAFWGKVFQPGCVGLLGLLMRSPIGDPQSAVSSQRSAQS